MLRSALLWLVALGSCAARAATGPADSLATVRLDIAPLDAHVYLRNLATGATVRVCTGACNVRIPTGEYRIDAGFSHRQLAAAPEPLAVAAGQDRRVHVTIEIREWRQRAAFGALLVGGGVFISGLPAYFIEGGFKQDAPRPVSLSLILTGAVLVLVGGVLAATDAPEVHAGEWTPQLTGDRP
jgi:hypothetical protein